MKSKLVKPTKYDEQRAEKLIDEVYDQIDKAVHLAEGRIASLLAQERDRCAQIVERNLSSSPWLAVKIADEIRKGVAPKYIKKGIIPKDGSEA
jgi:hypothetical protein